MKRVAHERTQRQLRLPFDLPALEGLEERGGRARAVSVLAQLLLGATRMERGEDDDEG